MTWLPYLSGVIPILVTPFTEAGAVDLDALDQELDLLVAAGVACAGFGFGSEVPRLSDAELAAVVRRAVEHTSDRMHIFGNVEMRSRAGGIEQAKRTAATGAELALVRPSMLGGVPQAALVDTFAAVTGEGGIPIVVQDAPQSTGVELTAETLARLLVDVPGVAAVKIESAAPAQKIEQIGDALHGQEGTIIGGSGGLDYLHELERGAHGTMPGPAHPEVFAALTRLHRAGRHDEARAMMARILPLLELGRRDMESFLVVQKHVLVRRGVLRNHELGRPHRPVDPRLIGEIDALLDGFALLDFFEECRTNYRIPHVDQVEVPRAHVLRVTFDDGLVRELEFLIGSNQGTVFAPLDDPAYFAQVRVNPESRTVTWPNGVDLDPAVLHGDFEPAGDPHFRPVAT